MTQPNDEWIEEMSKLLKEHSRAATMRDGWERKRAAVAATIDAYRAGNAHNLTPPQEPDPEQVWETEQA